MAAEREGVVVTDQQDLLVIPTEAIEAVVGFTLAHENASGSVEVVLVDDELISDLHDRYLSDPTPTDVITFPYDDEETPELPGEPRVLGEIVVSTETARRQAPDYLGNPVIESLLYVIHGVLHLLGYDDHAEADRSKMDAAQHAILEAWEAAGRPGLTAESSA